MFSCDSSVTSYSMIVSNKPLIIPTIRMIHKSDVNILFWCILVIKRLQIMRKLNFFSKMIETSIFYQWITDVYINNTHNNLKKWNSILWNHVSSWESIVLFFKRFMRCFFVDLFWQMMDYYFQYFYYLFFQKLIHSERCLFQDSSLPYVKL